MFAQLSVLNEKKIMLLLKCATWMNFIYYFWATANISRAERSKSKSYSVFTLGWLGLINVLPLRPRYLRLMAKYLEQVCPSQEQ